MSSSDNPPRNQHHDSETDDEEDREEGGHMIGDVYIPPPPAKPSFSGEETGRRIVITHITNINFKSYAGEKVLGPFDKSFTSIVGPNGSGKSNVIDSMLFVFGYRAQKLRSKRLSVLIHNSDTYPDCRSCEVRVHFAILDDRGGDDYELVSGSEFAISWTAFKDNSSHYSIIRDGEKQKVQFKDVSKLLQSHGIDLRYNRFLILQGEVEQIALMKPKAENDSDVGLLEFLEDIIGSNRLKVPLAKLEERVFQMNELRSEKLNRVKAIESEKTALEGPRNEAIRFIQTENQITRKKNLLYQLLRREAEIKKQDVENQFKKADEAYRNATKEIDEMKEKREELEKVLSEQETSATHKQQEYETCKAEFNRLEQRDLQARDQIKFTKKKGKKLEEDLEKEKDKLSELKRLPDKLQAEIVQLEEKKLQVESAKAEADAELESVMKQISEDTEKFQSEKERFEKQLLDMAESLTEAKSQKEVTEAEYNILQSREKQALATLDQLKYRLESATREVEDKKKALQRFTATLPDMENEYKQLSRELDEKTQEKAVTEQDIRSMRAKVSEAKSHKTSERSRNRILDGLRRAKVPGFCGRLGDLGSIDPKYDIAISTACGRLDNMVTETIEDAMRCVDYLKQHNLGTATFIALDKVGYLEGQWDERSANVAGCPRLFDLIQTDAKFKRAFWFGLYDTIVARDLDQGTDISQRQRIRIVTLNGQMIETTGAMSGGGRPSKGRMKLTSAARISLSGGEDISEDQLKELENELQNRIHSLEELDQRIRTIHSKQDVLQQEMNTMKSNAPQVRMQVEAKTKDLESLKVRISEAERNAKEATCDPKALKEAEKKCRTANAAFESVEKEASKIRNKVDSINERIKEVVDQRLGGTKSKVQKLKKEIDSIESEISKKSASKKTTERNVIKSEEKITALQNELQESVKLIADLKEEMKRLEEEATDITNRYKAAESESKAMAGELERVKKEIEASRVEEAKLRTHNLDAKHEVDKLSSLLSDKQSDVKRWTEKIRGLELQPVPDDENSLIEEEDDESEVDGEQGKNSPDAEAGTEAAAAASVSQAGDQPDSGSQSSQQKNESPAHASKQVPADVPVDGVRKVKTSCKVDTKQLKEYSEDELSRLSIASVKSSLEAKEQELKSMKPNMAAIEEYRKKVDVFLSRSKELSEVTARRDMFKSQFEQLRSQRMTEFKQGFTIITRKLKEMYRMITSGGDAELEWADSLDPFSEGINFSVRPNKKSWKRISNLSGGEKTLSSLSLIFALHYFKPSPLYVMDEIDAALDFKNVSIVANYIKERTKNTQFIIISLRNNMYELANRLVGIYKTHNCTKSICFIPDGFKDLSV